jgi:cell division septum initiation protein DivIVA
MNENADLLPDLLNEEFEVQMRGYSRRQVDEFVARRTSEIRDLEQRLSRSLDEAEHLRREMSMLRQHAMAGRPAHEELSERMAQILKLADDEARAQKDKASEEISKLRSDAAAESERVRSDAREQAERMLAAAQEQAERALTVARGEADKTRTSARSEADRLASDARNKADALVADAKAQAKKVLDEATARATAIHDGADRRLNMLSNRHADTVRRLKDILEGVGELVSAENAKPSLEDEVEQTVARTLGNEPGDSANAAPVAAAPAPAPVVTPARSAPIVLPAGPVPAAAPAPAAAAPAAPAASAPVASAPVPSAPAASGPLAPPNPATRVRMAGAPPVPTASAPDPSAGSSRTAGPAGAGRGARRGEAADAAQSNPASHTGLIGPDEVDEGIRLLPN